MERLVSLAAQDGGAHRARMAGRSTDPATNGKPVVRVALGRKPTSFQSRRKYKCKACYHQFSLTSGTIFASRKLAFVDLLSGV